MATSTCSRIKISATTATLFRRKRLQATAAVLDRFAAPNWGTADVAVTAMASGLLGKCDARIDQGVSQVGQQKGHADERGGGQRGGHDQRIIPVYGRVDKKLADAGYPEDAFDKERPGDQAGRHR